MLRIFGPACEGGRFCTLRAGLVNGRMKPYGPEDFKFAG
jgi:hypothetical protein